MSQRKLTEKEVKKIYDILKDGPVKKGVIKRAFHLNDATFSSFMFAVGHNLPDVWEDVSTESGKRVVFVGVNRDIECPERRMYENVYRD